MSGMASGSVMGVGVGGDELGYGGYRPPFTAVQWQELEQQAMVYKYLVAGVPVPPDLVLPIRHSLEALSARFFQHPPLGYCSYYGKKFDPEPGRCRRTDGKKWRCSKDAHSDSKYCERHMHRGRNRSRKPVESQSVIASSHISTNCTTQNIPFYSVGSNVTKLHSDVSYRMDSKEIRYNHVPTPNADDHSFSLENARSVGNLGLGSNASSETWNTSQVSSSSLFKRKSDSQLGGHTLDPIDAAMPKQRQQQQHCFFGNDTSSAGPMKAEQNPMQLFFGEWSTTKESWSNLDDDDKQNVFSSTQLSMSIPRAASDLASRTTFSTNDA